MEGQNPELTEEIVKLLGAELITLKKQIIVLKEDNSALLTRAQSAEGELSLLKSEDPEDVKSNSQTRRTKLEENNSEGNVHLTHSLKAANEERQQLRNKVATFRDLVSERDTKITELDAEISNYEASRERTAIKLESQKAQIKEQRRELEKLRAENTRLLECEEDLKSQQDTAISEESHQIMRDKLESYKVRGREKKETIQSLETELDSARTSMVCAQRTREEMEDRILDLEKQRSGRDRAITQMQRKNAGLKTSVDFEFEEWLSSASQPGTFKPLRLFMDINALLSKIEPFCKSHNQQFLIGAETCTLAPRNEPLALPFQRAIVTDPLCHYTSDTGSPNWNVVPILGTRTRGKHHEVFVQVGKGGEFLYCGTYIVNQLGKASFKGLQSAKVKKGLINRTVPNKDAVPPFLTKGVTFLYQADALRFDYTAIEFVGKNQELVSLLKEPPPKASPAKKRKQSGGQQKSKSKRQKTEK